MEVLLRPSQSLMLRGMFVVCSNPITLQSKTGAEYRVACGKCLCCRAAKSKQWTIRLKHEQAYWDREGFLTLTYDDDHLPDGGRLVKRDLVKFFKRLRRLIEPRKIRYFACGEYGSQTFRPHYHAIIFGLDSRDLPIIAKAWGLSDRISIDPVFPGAIAYVCGYVRKKIALQYIIYRDRDLPFPFQLQSQGLGLRWALDNKDLLIANGLTYQGKSLGLPRYYIDKLDLSCDSYYSDLVARLDDYDKDLLDRGFTTDDFYRLNVEAGIQRGINARGKEALSGR